MPVRHTRIGACDTTATVAIIGYVRPGSPTPAGALAAVVTACPTHENQARTDWLEGLQPYTAPAPDDTPCGDAVAYTAADVGPRPKAPPPTIVKAVQTSTACPSQWDTWTSDGRYLYLRYRNGSGTAHLYPGARRDTSDQSEEIAAFTTPASPGEGWISLEDFCARAGLPLALRH